MTVDNYQDTAKTTLFTIMAKAGIGGNIAELHRRLGVDTSYQTLRQRIERGSFSYAFVLEVADKLGVSVELKVE